MAKEIIWTPRAEKTFEKIINYLEKNWNEKEIEKFIELTNNIIQTISHQPEIFRHSKKIHIHEALITKHNILIYRIKEHSIDLIAFWDTRQNPKKKFKFLK